MSTETQRAEFEAIAFREGLDVTRGYAVTGFHAINQDVYRANDTQQCWQFWQAAQASQAAEIEALKADIATYVRAASEQATEIEALRKGAAKHFTKEQKLIDERDELRRALEIIAVGDAKNPQQQAADELIALGWWRDIAEARAAMQTKEAS